MNFKIRKKLEESGSYKIAFLGDSITSAEWVHPNWRDIVEYVLKENLRNDVKDWKKVSWGIRCINAGFDGATTNDLLNLLQENVLEYKPDMVIVMATSNDVILGVSLDQHKINLTKILDSITANVSEIIYCTDICSGNTDYNNKYELYVKEAISLFPRDNVGLINTFEEFGKFDLSSFFTFDSEGNEEVGIDSGETDFIHPNQLGNAYIAKIILEKVFGMKFNPERYMEGTAAGLMFPGF